MPMPHIWEIEVELVKKLSYWTDLDNLTQNTVYQDILTRWARNGRNWTYLDNFVQNYVDVVMDYFSDQSSSEEGNWEMWAKMCRGLNHGRL